MWATSTLAQYAMHSLPYVQKSLPQTGLYTSGVFAQLHPTVARGRDEKLARSKLICNPVVQVSMASPKGAGIKGTFARVGLPQCASAGRTQRECSRRQQHDMAHGRLVAISRCRVEVQPGYRLHRPQDSKRGDETPGFSLADRHISCYARDLTVTAHQHEACGGISGGVRHARAPICRAAGQRCVQDIIMCSVQCATIDGRPTEAFKFGRDQGSDHRRCRRPRQPSSAVYKCSARPTRPLTRHA